MRKRILLVLLALTLWGSSWAPRQLGRYWFQLIAPTAKGAGFLLGQSAPVSAAVFPGAYTFTAPGTGSTINLIGTGVRYHQIFWNATGNFTSCGFVVQTQTGSGGVIAGNWSNLLPTATGATIDCSKQQGAVFIANSKVNYVRIQVPLFVCGGGGTCSVSIGYRGYLDDPTVARSTGNTAVVALASTGLTQVVAAQTDKIGMTFFFLTVTPTAASNQGITFNQGTGVNCATGNVALTGKMLVLSSGTSSVPIQLTSGNGAAVVVAQTTSGQALCMNTDNSSPVNGWITWTNTP